MTVIAGLMDGGRVFLGADSASVGGLRLSLRKDPKVFKIGPFVIGHTTSWRMGQLLRYELNPLLHHPVAMDDHEFMVRVFVEAVRRTFREGGWLQKDNEREAAGQFLIGYKGQLYEMDSDLQVAIPFHDFTAVGCGADLALGSLCTTHGCGAGPEARILDALQSAETFSAGVRGPFHIISGGRENGTEKAGLVE